MTRREQVARAVADDISRFSLASTLLESAHDSTRAQHTPPPVLAVVLAVLLGVALVLVLVSVLASAQRVVLVLSGQLPVPVSFLWLA
jgi:hypothetical protein